ncbi:MAG: CoA ester lyase [Magnetococcales bacterium]|nr:CoA ester lyase [Magnetococcales bacterium]
MNLLRSLLYVPGSNPRALGKLPALGADGAILDLEDSVAPDAKAQARSHILTSLQKIPPEQMVRTVRINAIDTPLWQKDVEGVLPGKPDAIVLSKVDGIEAIEQLTAHLATLETQVGHPHPTPIWAMIESPRGVQNAPAIADHPRTACLVMGTSDLTSALRLKPGINRAPLHFALQQTILAARAADIPVVDGVFVDLKNPEGFAAQCREGATLGFDGKSVIHPSQVEPANLAFQPTPEEIDKARRVLESWQAAQARGEEICLMDGELLERLHARQAARILGLDTAFLDGSRK